MVGAGDGDGDDDDDGDGDGDGDDDDDGDGDGDGDAARYVTFGLTPDVPDEAPAPVEAARDGWLEAEGLVWGDELASAVWVGAEILPPGVAAGWVFGDEVPPGVAAGVSLVAAGALLVAAAPPLAAWGLPDDGMPALVGLAPAPTGVADGPPPAGLAGEVCGFVEEAEPPVAEAKLPLGFEPTPMGEELLAGELLALFAIPEVPVGAGVVRVLAPAPPGVEDEAPPEPLFVPGWLSPERPRPPLPGSSVPTPLLGPAEADPTPAVLVTRFDPAEWPPPAPAVMTEVDVSRAGEEADADAYDADGPPAVVGCSRLAA